MKRKLGIITSICFLFTSIFVQGPIPQVMAAAQTTFYVSPSGNDSNSGTQSAPFKTIEKARDTVRTINSSMTGDIYVYLMDGTYALSSTLTLGPADSGTNGYNVIYSAAPGASPVISGGADITTGWILHDSSKNIYKKTGIDWNFRQLYINETRGVRARTPNLTDEITGGPYLRATNGGIPYTFNSSELGSWLNNGTAEMVYVTSWSQNRGRIANYSGNTVNFKFPDNTFAHNHHSMGNAPYFFENDYSLLDAEGEWFLDTANSTLYYKPRSGETMNTTTIVAPRLETVVNFLGSSTNSKVHNIKFTGFTVEHSNWLAPSNYGYVDIQAGFRYQTVGGGNTGEIRNTARYTAPASMVQLKYTSNIILDHNTFKYAGGWGVMGYEGTDHTTISWNTFYKNAGGGVAMGIVGDRWDDDDNPSYTEPDGQSLYDTITDNTIDTVALDYKDMVGIGAMLPQNMTIARNEIKNLPYSGISIGWNWSDHDHGMVNNQVYQNKVHDDMKLLQDGGGIYTIGKMTGNSDFYYNYIYNMRQSAYAAYMVCVGIYCDGNTSFRKLISNVIDNTELTFFINGPQVHDNILLNNYYGNNDIGWTSLPNDFIGNVKVSNGSWPQEALNIMNATGPGAAALPAHAPSPANIAVNKTATASSYYADCPEDDAGYAVDGNVNSRWAQGQGLPDPSWLKVDLGANYPITGTSTLFEKGSGYKYKIEYSTDNTNWTIYSDKTASYTTQQINEDTGSAAARYVRITVTDSSYNGGSIYEFRVYSNSRSISQTMSPPLNGLSLWIKANSSVARDSNNFVDRWADQSGNGFNAVQSAQANKPVFVQNAINGMPAIQFDGIDDLLTAAGVTGNYSNCTIFTVMKPSALTDYNQSMGASGAWGQFNFHSSANGAVYAGTDTNTRFVTAANTMVNNQVQQFTYRLSDGWAALYKNGAAIAGGTQTSPASWTGYMLGRTNNGTISGCIAEVLVYNKALNNADRQYIENYLKAKYGY